MEEKTALLEGVKKHRFDFEKIKASSGARLGKRSASALQAHLYANHPSKVKELRVATPSKHTDLWTVEEKTALLEGVEKHGLNFDKMKAHNDPRLSRRNDRASYSLSEGFIRYYPEKYRELMEKKALAKHEVL